MAYWNGLISLFPDQGMMQRYIIELYTVVFEFLTEIFTGWSKSSWKRFITSFDEQAFNKLFVEKRKRMKAIEHRMERHANGAHMQSNLTFQRDMSKMQNQVQTLTQMMQQLGIDVQSVLESKITRTPCHVAVDSPDRLLESPHTKLIGPEVIAADLVNADSATNDGAADNNQTAADAAHYSVRDALALLEPIAAQYNKSIQELVGLTFRALKISVDLQIKRHLEIWKSSMTSNMIWMQGPHDVSHPSQNTLTAACLVGLANNAKVPFISYFASLQSRNPRGTYLSAPEILLNMVKSLLVQLLLLQERPDTAVQVAAEDFKKLLGPVADLDAALDILGKLRGLVPQYLLCFIESVQVLEDRGDSRHTGNLRRVLQELINLGQPLDGDEIYKTVKICFTSDGHVDVLAVAAQGGFLEKIAFDGDEGGDGEQLRSLWDDEARSDEGG